MAAPARLHRIQPISKLTKFEAAASAPAGNFPSPPYFDIFSHLFFFLTTDANDIQIHSVGTETRNLSLPWENVEKTPFSHY